jgi:hypothetical protein
LCRVDGIVHAGGIKLVELKAADLDRIVLRAVAHRAESRR